ncbi:MAG: hypothetical protein WCG91_01925 [Candidatus Shapirobacteria bacterium]
MKKIIIVLIIVAVIFGFYKLTAKAPASTNTDYQNSDFILFYGSSCPHCKVVEEFIAKNEIDKKLKISQLEVYENKSNSALFAKTVKEICPDKITADGLIVPFLINPKDKQCYLGDQPIIDYLTAKSK